MPTTNTIALTSIDNLPSGSAKKDTSFNVPSTGTTQPISITSETTSGKSETAKIIIPAGAKFVTADETPVSGNINTRLIHTIP